MKTIRKYLLAVSIFLTLLGLFYVFTQKSNLINLNKFINSSLIGQKKVVTVKNCGEDIVFDKIPERATSFDTNMTEIMLALDLQDKMVGYWISGVPVGDEYKDKIQNVPLISDTTWPPPGMEKILSFNPDFVFGAWEYNFSEESGVNPGKLANAGIKSYVLSESCIAVGVKPSTTIDNIYQDILNLGAIFNVNEKAQSLVDQMKGDIANIKTVVGQVERPLRGMYYGGGDKAAFSCGKYGMASKMMNIVGAQNILGDVEDDWIPEASWETIIAKDPEFIMVDDTPWESAQKRIQTLESLPKLSGVTAIKEKRYIIFPWTYILPGMEMDEGISHLAKSLYPDKFK